jgi:hypothetical protein
MIIPSIIVPLRALLVGAAGAAIAWGWYDGKEWLSFLAPVVVILIGEVISEAGVRGLPSDPVWAVRLMPWRVLVPMALAAAAAGLVIIVTVEVALPDKTSAGAPTPDDLKEIVAALSAAVTAFLGAAFIDWTGDGNDSRVSDWIRSVFLEKYSGVFKPGSQGEQLVFSSYVGGGWGARERTERARRIKAAYDDPGQRA